eukprot:4398624-Pleurochrysis_carterae.AAC.1
MSSLSTISWEYDGKHKSPEPLDNLNIAQYGDIVKHAVFGLCTLLPKDGAGCGNLKVKVHSDGSERELTSGHFQLVSAGSKDLKPAED